MTPDAAAGRTEFFFAAMVIYAAANACIGATPAAYAADVMPSAVSGFGLGIYRCAGDVGMPHVCSLIADIAKMLVVINTVCLMQGQGLCVMPLWLF